MGIVENGRGGAVPFVTRGGGGGHGRASAADGGPFAAELTRGGRGGACMEFPTVSRNLLSVRAAEADAGPKLGVGDVVGGYKIVGESGTPGAFGRVWIAQAEHDEGFKVAIKEMLREDEDRREELRATFKLVSGIKNDHIADPVRIAEKDGRLYTIMRFAKGVSLDKWVSERGGMLPLPLACEIGHQIADALDAAHRKKVMHLDIKPDNVMVEDLPDGGVHVQVLDFGLARRIDPEGEVLKGLGTTEYIAPEMWLARQRPDGRADQYSLACVLYWMLSGTTPFRKAFSAAWRQLNREYPDASEEELKKVWAIREEDVGRKVAAHSSVHPLATLDKGRNKALLRGLDKEPGNRHGSCRALVHAVRHGPSTAWKPFALLLAMMVIGGGVLFAWGHLEMERQQSLKDFWERIKELGGISGMDALRAKAEGGDAAAAFELAQRLATGTNIQKDEREAFRWFARAGELGHAEAMFRAGNCLERGIGTERDERTAAEWYRRAAENGNPDGAGAYAACLWDGRGVGQDHMAANEWAQKGLDFGIPAANWVAGLALVEGTGAEQNPQRGATLVQAAAEAGDARACFAYAGLLSRGVGVSTSERGESAAAKWSLRAAEKGLPEAMLDMGERYATGRGVLANADESKRWFERAAEIDENATRRRRESIAAADAKRRKAEAEESARRAAEAAEARADAADPTRALLRRAEAGDSFAAFELAKRLDDGIGVRKNPTEAVRWWKVLAENPLADARDADRQKEAWGRYGMHLFEGTGVGRNVAAALPWLEKFADATEDEYRMTEMLGAFQPGNATDGQTPTWTGRERAQRRGAACLAVAGAYEKGDGVAKNLTKAESWYEKGASDSDECLSRLLRLMVERPRDFSEYDLRRRSMAGAQKGNLDGLYLCGRLELEGPGGLFRCQGFQKLLKAAQGGHLEAQQEVGSCYADGKGTGKDPKKAYEWFLKAAERGHVGAQVNVGFCLAYGDGVGKDMRKAFEWFQKAAAQGSDLAQFNLGVLYENGDVVPADAAKARMWYEKAAAQGNTQAKERLQRLEARVRARQAGQAPSPAARQSPPAQQGAGVAPAKNIGEDPDALVAMGYRYITGDGVARDARKAAECFRKAADKGHAMAQFNLGVCYEEGEGVPKNLATAASLYRQAAEKGMSNAQYNYGIFLLDGRGVRKDRSGAIVWLRKAAAQGHAGAKKVLKELGQ